MIDTKVILALALLLGSLAPKLGPGKPPAGGVPIPQHGTGVHDAQ
jgi:hypothetical protein